MTEYQLVLLKEKPKGVPMDVGENIFFDNLPLDYEVFLLCYAGTGMNEDLRNKLTSLGEQSGKNLLVNFAKLNDPNYTKIRNAFDIEVFPTIIVTGIGVLASPPTEYSTAYVKMDNKQLLNSPDQAAECVERVFNLFLAGEISEAIKDQNRAARNAALNKVLKTALGGIRGFLREWEISFSFINGTFSLKPTGGS